MTHKTLASFMEAAARYDYGDNYDLVKNGFYPEGIIKLFEKVFGRPYIQKRKEAGFDELYPNTYIRGEKTKIKEWVNRKDNLPTFLDKYSPKNKDRALDILSVLWFLRRDLGITVPSHRSTKARAQIALETCVKKMVPYAERNAKEQWNALKEFADSFKLKCPPFVEPPIRKMGGPVLYRSNR
jgi:hypothetical protein